MGKRNKEKAAQGSASRRRTVLQIEPVSRRKEYEAAPPSSGVREINPTSISGIGLLGQYADNSDDEEESSNDNSHQVHTGTSETPKPAGQDKEVDSKLVDFFKEIEAISSNEPTAEGPSEASAESELVQEQPVVSSTQDTHDSNACYEVPYPWQKLCDPNTNYMYYWNTLTNEVSWEMPQVVPDSSQQLITEQDTTYPDHTTSLDAAPTAGTLSEQQEQTCQGAARAPPEHADIVEEKPCTDVPDEEGCDSPSTDVAGSDVAGTDVAGTDVAGIPPDESETDVSERLVPLETRSKKTVVDIFQNELAEEGGHYAVSSPQSGYDSPASEPPATGHDSPIAEEMPEYPPTPEDVDEPSSPSLTEHDSDDHVTTSSGVVEPRDDDENKLDVPEESAKEEVIQQDDDGDETPAKKAKYDSDHGSDEDFAEKLLEEFLEGKPSEASSHDDMDVDSGSDNEVELGDDGPLLPPEAFQHNQDDESAKEDGVSQAQNTTDRLKDEHEERLTTQIYDLCAVLSSKLDFLNITKDGVNKLQLVLLQMETRIKDWREGALSSEYLMKRLQDADEALRKYEQSAAPDGWSCHWESSYKRYFYTDEKTGQSQWDYPHTTDATTTATTTTEPAVVTTAPSWGASSTVLYSSTASYPVMAATMDHTQASYPTPSVATAAVYPVVVAPDPTPSVAVTQGKLSKDPYRINDNDIDEEDGEHTRDGNTPPPPGESPPPPPPDLPTIPPPPPPPKEEPAEAPLITDIASGPVHFATHEPPTAFEALDVQSNLLMEAKRSSQGSPVLGATSLASKVKKKKTKSSASSIRTSKVKKMSSLVQKWQAIKKQDEEVSEDESDDEDQVAKTEANIVQWRKEQIVSGQAAGNPNFQEIKGDWRERVRKAKMRTTKADSPNP